MASTTSKPSTTMALNSVEPVTRSDEAQGIPAMVGQDILDPVVGRKGQGEARRVRRFRPSAW